MVFFADEAAPEDPEVTDEESDGIVLSRVSCLYAYVTAVADPEILKRG